MTTPKTALVHEWLVGWGGSESVLASFARLLPSAPIHTLVHVPDARVRDTFRSREIRTTWIHRLPGVERYYRYTLPLMPRAWRGVELGEAELVLSSSHAFCKGVRVPDGAVHVCYCHTPPRYLWDLADGYRQGGAWGLSGPLLAWLRRRDLEGAANVDHFLANSRFVAERVRRTYGRESTVVYPPVDVDAFPEPTGKGEYFLAGGRLVGYKRVDLAIRAANMGRLPLVVFGDGPERLKLEAMAGASVSFVGSVSQRELVALIRDAKAYLFPGIEDFGILPVEVQAGGRPVVALAKGGAPETVLEGETGALFADATPEALLDAVNRVGTLGDVAPACRRNAARFSRDRFEASMRLELERVLDRERVGAGARPRATAPDRTTGTPPARSRRLPPGALGRD